jgi:hypothetical protein
MKAATLLFSAIKRTARRVFLATAIVNCFFDANNENDIILLITQLLMVGSESEELDGCAAESGVFDGCRQTTLPYNLRTRSW